MNTVFVLIITFIFIVVLECIAIVSFIRDVWKEHRKKIELKKKRQEIRLMFKIRMAILDFTRDMEINNNEHFF